MSTNPVGSALGPVARIFALIAGYGILGVALLITAEVLLRRLLNISLQGGDEYGGYMLAVLAAFGFSYALLERSHTRVELFLERMPTALQRTLDLVSVLSITAMAIFMGWRGVATVMETLEYGSLSGTPLMTPLWRPQAVWAIGLVFFATVALAMSVHALVLFARRSPALGRFYGAKTLGEEIEEQKTQLSERSAAQ